MITLRTNEHAEEEARLVMNKIAHICVQSHPNVFSDMEENNGGEFVPEYVKV